MTTLQATTDGAAADGHTMLLPELGVIEASTVLMPDFTVRPCSTGFVAVDLGMGADPEAFTEEVIESEARRMGGRDSWRFRKEYLRDFDAQSGQPVFDPRWIDVQRARQRNPKFCMRVDSTSKLVRCAGAGPIKIFVEPGDRPPGMPLRAVDRQVGIGADIGEGVGGNDSAAVGLFADTGEEAFEFRANNIRPDKFGLALVELGRMYNTALICPVRKAHGITTLRAMVDAGYGRIWRSRDPRRYTQTPTNLLGWPWGEVTHNNLLLDKWSAVLERDGVVLYGMDLIEEHSQFIFDDNGRPTVQSGKTLSLDARARHGDLVIAAGLANIAVADMPKYRNVKTLPSPGNCYAWRRKQRDRHIRKTRREW